MSITSWHHVIRVSYAHILDILVHILDMQVGVHQDLFPRENLPEGFIGWRGTITKVCRDDACNDACPPPLPTYGSAISDASDMVLLRGPPPSPHHDQSCMCAVAVDYTFGRSRDVANCVILLSGD